MVLNAILPLLRAIGDWLRTQGSVIAGVRLFFPLCLMCVCVVGL